MAANLRLASESPLFVHAQRIALGDRTPVVLANLGSDRYHPGSLASERPVLVVRWGLLSMVVRSVSLSVSCAQAGVYSWVDVCVRAHWQIGNALPLHLGRVSAGQAYTQAVQCTEVPLTQAASICVAFKGAKTWGPTRD
jgi:hypothetical protein